MENGKQFNAKNVLTRSKKIIFAECDLEYLEKYYVETKEILDYTGIIFKNINLSEKFDKLPVIEEEQIQNMIDRSCFKL